MSQDQAQLEFTPLEMGNMAEIPPDAPDGKWIARIEVKKKLSAKGAPMLILENHLQEALTPGNENHVGKKVSRFLVIRGASDPHVKMFRADVKEIAEATGVSPSFEQFSRWSDADDYVRGLEANLVTCWTKNKKDKETGELRTEVSYRAPKEERGLYDEVAAPAQEGKKRRRG